MKSQDRVVELIEAHGNVTCATVTHMTRVTRLLERMHESAKQAKYVADNVAPFLPPEVGHKLQAYNDEQVSMWGEFKEVFRDIKNDHERHWELYKELTDIILEEWEDAPAQRG